MSRFIESIKIEDREPFLLDLHQKRVNETLWYFGQSIAPDLAQIFKDLQHDEDGLYKLRIVYGLDLDVDVQLIPYAASEIPHFKLIENNSIDYSFKFEDRHALEHMKTRTGLGEPIIVKNGYVTDTTYSNLLFLREDSWITPHTFLLNGVQRQSLLNQKKIKEAEISPQNLTEFSHFQLINALNGFNETFIYPIERISNLPVSDALDF